MTLKPTGILTDPIFLEHQTGMHPENSERLIAILKLLQENPIWERLIKVPAIAAKMDDIYLVHEPNYVTDLEKQIKSGVDYVYSPDCAVSPQTFKVAQMAAGGAVQLIEMVLNGDLKNGLGLVRPPGHHAEKNHAMGFCYFNNIAICAEVLIRKKGLRKILIVDFDVHHGNGTQHFFEDRQDVFYVSIHQSPNSCFPGTGFVEETGKGEGKGYTLNVPMHPGADDGNYLKALNETIVPAWNKYKPDFVLISAGFDAHTEDPLAQISITEKTYRAFTKALVALANTSCDGKLVSLLEGGYNLQVIPSLVLAHLEEMVT
jgi:acetoin utilization deacetylase AcuC-like enzyme